MSVNLNVTLIYILIDNCQISIRYLSNVVLFYVFALKLKSSVFLRVKTTIFHRQFLVSYTFSNLDTTK